MPEELNGLCSDSGNRDNNAAVYLSPVRLPAIASDNTGR